MTFIREKNWDNPWLLHCLLITMFIGMGGLGFPDRLFAQPSLKEVLDIQPEGMGEEIKAEIKKSEEGSVEKEKVEIPNDEFGRGVPRTSVAGFFRFVQGRDFNNAAQYLDLRNLPEGLEENQGPELARKLHIVLSRTLWVDLENVSTEPQGFLDDGLPVYRDLLGRIQSKEAEFDLLLQRVPRGDGMFIWKISNRTVGQIPEMYAIYGHGHLDNIFPSWFFDYRLLEIYVWEWVAMIVSGLLAYLVVRGVTSLILYVFRPRFETGLGSQIVRHFKSPVQFLAWVLLTRYGITLFGQSLVGQAIYHTGTIFLIAVAWAVMKTIDFLAYQMAENLRKKGQDAITVLFPPLKTGCKFIILMVTVIFWVDNLGFEVTTLLAGLGIGGLALALAAQKSLENVFGALTLYTSRHVWIGDFCKFGEQFGRVEEIGLRSTLIRTLDHTVVSISNAEFSTMQIENYSKREKICYHPRIRLHYETTPDQLRYILIEIRKALYAHPKVLSDPARIRLTEFGDYSLDLAIFAYVDVTDYGEYLEIAEDLNLRIIDIVNSAGSKFAIPSQALYIRRGKPMDEEKIRGSENAVREWRSQNALFLPRFPDEKIEELRGTLDFPPQGSPDAVARA